MNDQGAGYKDCPECDGHGHFEAVIGERQGIGGIEPIIRTTTCEDCDDDGFVEKTTEELVEEIEVQKSLKINLVGDLLSAQAQRDALREVAAAWVKSVTRSDGTVIMESDRIPVSLFRAAIAKATA